MYYRGAHAAFVVYDIRCWASFHIAKSSVEKLRNEVSISIIFTNDSIKIHRFIQTLLNYLLFSIKGTK